MNHFKIPIVLALKSKWKLKPPLTCSPFFLSGSSLSLGSLFLGLPIFPSSLHPQRTTSAEEGPNTLFLLVTCTFQKVMLREGLVIVYIVIPTLERLKMLFRPPFGAKDQLSLISAFMPSWTVFPISHATTRFPSGFHSTHFEEVCNEIYKIFQNK